MDEQGKSKEKGAIMVEAAIYIPIALCLVIALIELALFNMQEYLMMYEAQRVSAVVARDVAYYGYDNFNMGEDNEIDFKSFPSSGQIRDYYAAYTGNIQALYREVGGLFKAAGLGKTDTSGFEGTFSDAAAASSLIAVGMVSPPDIEVKDGLLGTSVTVTFTHEIPVPGVIKYLGYQGTTNLRVAAYSYSVNPSEFARNVDLAADMADYVIDKLGLSGKFEGLKDGINKVLDKIL